MKDEVYLFILKEGELGATAYQIDLFLGEGASKHIEELYLDGKIEPGEHPRFDQVSWITKEQA